MSALKILIVDDEAPARRRLNELLEDVRPSHPVTVVGEASHGREALERLPETQPDVVLMDIRMPVMDGIEAAEHLHKLESPPAVIFTTAYDEYAIRAFEVNAIDYLLKPVRAERLAAALQKAKAVAAARLEALRASLGTARTHLSISERGRIVLVPLTDIIYLRAELKYVTVKTAAKEYLIEESLVKLEQEFGNHFVRIHRNCLVARPFIERFERAGPEAGEEGEAAGSGWVVVVRALGERLPVSRRQQHVIREFRR